MVKIIGEQIEKFNLSAGIDENVSLLPSYSVQLYVKGTCIDIESTWLYGESCSIKISKRIG